MKSSGDVDHVPKNGQFRFGFVLPSGRTVTFDLANMAGQGALITDLPALLCNFVSLLPACALLLQAEVTLCGGMSCLAEVCALSFLLLVCTLTTVCRWTDRKDKWMSGFVQLLMRQTFSLETNGAQKKSQIKEMQDCVSQANIHFKWILNRGIGNIDQLGKNID